MARPPTCNYFIEDKKKIHIWTKSIPVILVYYLSLYFNDFNTGNYFLKLTHTIDIVFDGGHGQGKFRAFCKFILRDIVEIKIDPFSIEVAHISYSKESYHVLKSSIASPLDDRIRKLIDD